MNTRLRQRTGITDLVFGTWNIQTMGSRGLEAYCKGGQGPPRAVALLKKIECVAEYELRGTILYYFSSYKIEHSFQNLVRMLRQHRQIWPHSPPTQS